MSLPLSEDSELTSFSIITWWRHQMEAFSALLAICAGNSPVTGEFPAQRPVTRSFNVFLYLRLNTRLSKQSCGWWFETPSLPLWRHCNALLLTTCAEETRARATTTSVTTTTTATATTTTTSCITGTNKYKNNPMWCFCVHRAGFYLRQPWFHFKMLNCMHTY